MGFRDSWVKHQDLLSCHSEIFAHCMERVLLPGVKHVLHVGYGNGGTLQVISSLLPPDGSVLGLGSVEFDEVPTVVADLDDRRSIAGALGARWFDVIIDSTGVSSSRFWPFLRSGGSLVLERYDVEQMSLLLAAVAEQGDSWLPVEEILRVSLYPIVAAVEKRNPRVVPYLDVIIGKRDPVVPLSKFTADGAKILIVETQPE